LPTAIAIAAHPDDVEFGMAGTLLLLRRAGWSIHCLNLSSGNCGSVEMNAQETRDARRAEAQRAAGILGATWHPPFCDDLEILYEVPLLRKLAAVVRGVKPSVVLTHYPEDYMEDHMNACRLAVSAAFAHGMPNFVTDPEAAPFDEDVALYHAMPHGLCDALRRPAEPDLFVDTSPVLEQKLEALSAHRSQQGWLDASQGMSSYLRTMLDFSRCVGEMAGGWEHAEGWRRHLHWGLSAEEIDPLGEALAGSIRRPG
jgi:LmbE family N-acetylglucosaminyl deacetylase